MHSVPLEKTRGIQSSVLRMTNSFTYLSLVNAEWDNHLTTEQQGAEVKGILEYFISITNVLSYMEP